MPRDYDVYLEDIRDGAEAIYQATFLAGQWQGRADFVIRVDKAKRLLQVSGNGASDLRC